MSPDEIDGSGPQWRPIRFTGSGSEYFRIWIVNLLLTLVTLGIYLPWAKVRRLRYFYGNTLVDGRPLAFHGNPLLMLRGYAVMAFAFTAYAIISRISPVGALIAIALLGLVWPALRHASMRFRLANTSWRGMRLSFDGTRADAYKALLPALLPAFVVTGVGVWAGQSAALAAKPSPWIALVFPALLALVPAMLLRIKRYQHGHLVYGDEQTRLTASAGSFYGYFIKGMGLTLLLMLVFGAVAGGLFYSVAFKPPSPGTDHVGRSILSILLVTALMAFSYLLVLSVVFPYFAARAQNLIWNTTKSRRVAFHSTLRARSMIGLTLKIWLLMPLTLGFYWPFARIALARLRLENVGIRIEGGADALAGGAAPRQPGAAGDAAGEFLGFDLGF